MQGAITEEPLSALSMTAKDGGKLLLQQQIYAIPVGKASAPAYSQGCDVCGFCKEQKPVMLEPQGCGECRFCRSINLPYLRPPRKVEVQ